jgi:rubrerythrin
MNDRDFKRLLRRAVLGVSAAPLLWLPACGRSELIGEPDASVIPSVDGGTRDAGMGDGGMGDAGVRDAGVRDAGTDAGAWTILRTFCSPNDPVQTSVGLFYRDGGVMLDPQTCLALCPPGAFNQPISECTPASSWELVCWGEYCAVGRLAEGIETHADGVGLGRIFGDMAAHEAAAVVAFEQLAVELEKHSVSSELRRGALRAANEERRHTRLVGGLARERGSRFSISRATQPEVRSLEAIALDNAIEGCARETFGAMVGLYQSRHATDPSVRAVLASVAEDELGHASWSWALQDALLPRLSLSARRKIREAREEALATLTVGVLAGRTSEDRVQLGLPDESRLMAMAASLRPLAS